MTLASFFLWLLGVFSGFILREILLHLSYRDVGPVRYRLSVWAAIIGKIRGPALRRREARERKKQLAAPKMVASIIGATRFTDENNVVRDTHQWLLYQDAYGKRTVTFKKLVSYANDHHPVQVKIDEWVGGLRDAVLQADGTYWFTKGKGKRSA